MVHNSHHGVLVPPRGFLNALDLTPHDNDLSSWDKLAPSVRGAEMVGDARWRNIAVQRLRQAVDELCALAGVQNVRWAGGKHKVAVQVYHESIGRGVKQCTALSRHAKNVGTGFLYEILDMAGVNHWHVKTTPLVNANTVTDSFRGNGEHRRVVADENDAARGGYSGLNDTNDVRN